MIDPRKLYAAIAGEWDKTSQPLQDRASILPLGQYQDGSVGLAWPGLLAQPAQSFVRAANTPMPPINDDDAWRQMSQDSADAAGLAMTGGLGLGIFGGLADDAVRAAPRSRPQAPRPTTSPDPQAVTGEIIDSPAEMIRRAQQSPLWPKSWFESAGGHPGSPMTQENLLDAAKFVYRFEAQDKWDDAVAKLSGGSRPMGDALNAAEAKAFQENPQLWWDSRRTLQEQVEGRSGPMSEFDRIWDRVDAPPTTNVIDELLDSGVIQDAYLGPRQTKPRMLRANAPTASAVPLAGETHTDPAPYGYRPDGTVKGRGFYGELRRPDGDVSTEISMGMDFGGGETEIPLLVPTLTADERNWLLTNEPDPRSIPQSIVDKAAEHAIGRMRQGQSPFATEQESADTNPALLEYLRLLGIQ